MDITSSIAAASIYLKQSEMQQALSTAMTKKALDVQETAAANLIELLNQPIPSFGHKLDIKV